MIKNTNIEEELDIFLLHLPFKKYKHEDDTPRKMGQNARLCGNMLGNAGTGRWRPFSRRLMGIGDPLGNGQIVLETLWATLSE